MQTVLFSLPGIIVILLRVGVPIYLYQQAKQVRLPRPGWWILFGIFEPIVALIAFYVVSNFLRK